MERVPGPTVTAGCAADGPEGDEARPQGPSRAAECAWSARVREWLHAAYPHTPRDRIQVINMAKGSTTTQWAGTFLFNYAERLGQSLKEFDIFFVDYQVNDQNAGRDIVRSIEPSTEELLVQLLSLPQAPAVVYLFSGTLEMNSMSRVTSAEDPKYLEARPWLEDEQMKVLRYYQVPVLSWRDAFWHSAFSPEGERNPLLVCHDGKHPTACLHYVWAAVVAHLFCVEVQLYCAEAEWRAQANRAAPDIPRKVSWRDMLPAKKLAKEKFKKLNGDRFEAKMERGEPPRLAPLTVLSADGGEAEFLPVEIKPPGRWQFREDVAGKPGWIVEGPGGGEEISFDVMLSQRVVLGFMSSYENMGQVQVFVDKLQPTAGNTLPPLKERVLLKQATAPAMVVDSLWRAKSSQYSQRTVIDIPPKKPPIPVRVRLKRVEPKGGRNNPRGLNKFKLLALLSY
eukprot:jgi/Mesvir1/24623/Mv25136-RA.1